MREMSCGVGIEITPHARYLNWIGIVDFHLNEEWGTEKANEV